MELQSKMCLFYPEDKYRNCWYCVRPKQRQRCMFRNWRKVDPLDELAEPRAIVWHDDCTAIEKERKVFVRANPLSSRGSAKSTKNEPKRVAKKPKKEKKKASGRRVRDSNGSTDEKDVASNENRKKKYRKQASSSSGSESDGRTGKKRRKRHTDKVKKEKKPKHEAQSGDDKHRQLATLESSGGQIEAQTANGRERRSQTSCQTNSVQPLLLQPSLKALMAWSRSSARRRLLKRLLTQSSSDQQAAASSTTVAEVQLSSNGPSPDQRGVEPKVAEGPSSSSDESSSDSSSASSSSGSSSSSSESHASAASSKSSRRSGQTQLPAASAAPSSLPMPNADVATSSTSDATNNVLSPPSASAMVIDIDSSDEEDATLSTQFKEQVRIRKVDLSALQLKLSCLKWNYDGRQFNQKAAATRYTLQFRTRHVDSQASDAVDSALAENLRGGAPSDCSGSGNGADPQGLDKALATTAESNGNSSAGERARAGHQLVLQYAGSGNKSIVLDLLVDVDKLRYYAKASPLGLAIWTHIPLPPSLLPKSLREEYDESETVRRNRSEQDPQWIIAIFFPDSELANVQKMIHILKENYFPEMDDVEGLTHEAAKDLHDNDSQGAYSLAGQTRKEKKMVNGYNVRDWTPVAEVAGVHVYKGDYNRLHDGIYLNDVIIDFYLNHIKTFIPATEQNRFRILSPHFYAAVRQSPQKTACRWEKELSFFGHDFIFIPVNERNHWIVLMICYLRKVFDDLPGAPKQLADKPQITVLDSMHTGDKLGREVVPKVRAFLRERLSWELANNPALVIPKEKADPENLGTKKLRGVVCQVPKQPNRFDCGCYMLQFIENLVREPPTRPILSFPLSWVTGDQAHSKRTQIMRLLDTLQQQAEQARRRSKSEAAGPEATGTTTANGNHLHAIPVNTAANSSQSSAQASTTSCQRKPAAAPVSPANSSASSSKGASAATFKFKSEQS